jgi:hypothetical protein
MYLTGCHRKLAALICLISVEAAERAPFVVGAGHFFDAGDAVVAVQTGLITL